MLGTELLSFTVADPGIVRFSPDGRSLLVATGLYEALVFDGIAGREREAASQALSELEAASLAEEALRANDDRMLAAATAVRREMANSPSQSSTLIALTSIQSMRAERVSQLYEQLWLKDHVVEAIHQDASLSVGVRQDLLHMVELRGELKAGWLRSRAGGVAYRGDQGPEQYARALAAAELSDRLEPNELFTLEALGMSLYRCGRCAESAAALQRFRDMNKVTEIGYTGAHAFLAMVHHRLGNIEQAREWLARCRKEISNVDETTKSVIEEATLLIESSGR
jgi:hypothetical protein